MLTTLLAGAFVLGVVVLVHEFGHFIVAKWCGVYVKTFSIGFGKKVLKRRVGETVYAISVLPFGGYVKFAGESEYADEIEAAAQQEDAPPQPDDEVPDSEIPRERYFTTKRPIQRAAVLFAGPFMNYLLAVFLYFGMFFIQGTQVAPTTVIGEIVAGSPADSLGLQVGDELTAIDAHAVNDWGDVMEWLVDEPEAPKQFRLIRAGIETELTFQARVEDNALSIGFYPRVTAEVGRVQRDMPAHVAGIRPGAVIEAVNDTAVASFDDLRRIINRNAEVPVVVRWRQDGEVFVKTLVPTSKEALKAGSRTETITVGAIGIGPHYLRKRMGPVDSFVRGFSGANNMIREILTFLRLLVRGELGVETLGGPIRITQMAGDVARWGFDYLLFFLAFFSINLCIFNLLPLLPFDGGHLALLAVEGVTKRPVNRRLRELLTQAGFILVILLMVFVVVLDLSRCTGQMSRIF